MSGLGVRNGALMTRFAQLNRKGFNVYQSRGPEGAYFAKPPETLPGTGYLSAPYSRLRSGRLPDAQILAAVWEGLDKTDSVATSLHTKSAAWRNARGRDRVKSVTRYSDEKGERAKFGELGAIWMTVSEGNISDETKEDLREAFGGSLKFFDDTFAKQLGFFRAMPVPTREKPVLISSGGSKSADAIDGNLATFWSAKGDGAWLRLDFGSLVQVTQVDIAFLGGNTRKAVFSVEVSDDGNSWRPVLTRRKSSGLSKEKESFAFAGRLARYVRFRGHGNEFNQWNSVTEFSAVTTPADAPVAFAPGPVVRGNNTPGGQEILQRLARTYNDPQNVRMNKTVGDFVAHLESKTAAISKRAVELLKPFEADILAAASLAPEVTAEFPPPSAAEEAIDPRGRSKVRVGRNTFESWNFDIYASADDWLPELFPRELLGRFANLETVGLEATIGPHFDIRIYLPLKNTKTGQLNPGFTDGKAIDYSKLEIFIGIRVSRNVGINWFGSGFTGFSGVDLVTFWKSGRLEEVRMAPFTRELVGIGQLNIFPDVLNFDAIQEAGRQVGEASELLRAIPLKAVQVGSLSVGQIHWLRDRESGQFDLVPDMFTGQAIYAGGVAAGGVVFSRHGDSTGCGYGSGARSGGRDCLYPARFAGVGRLYESAPDRTISTAASF